MRHANVIKGDVHQLRVQCLHHWLVFVSLVLKEGPDVLRTALATIVAAASMPRDEGSGSI